MEPQAWASLPGQVRFATSSAGIIMIPPILAKSGMGMGIHDPPDSGKSGIGPPTPAPGQMGDRDGDGERWDRGVRALVPVTCNITKCACNK